MERYEWQKHMKTKYLDLAHAMQARGTPLFPPDAEFDRNVIVNDIKAANELIRACQEYIAEQIEWLEGE